MIRVGSHEGSLRRTAAWLAGALLTAAVALGASAGGAGAAGAPGSSLTRHFPLGGPSLCCGRRSGAGRPSGTGEAAPSAPSAPSTTSAPSAGRSAPPRGAGHPRSRSASGGPSPALLGGAAVLLAALLATALVAGTRRRRGRVGLPSRSGPARRPSRRPTVALPRWRDRAAPRATGPSLRRRPRPRRAVAPSVLALGSPWLRYSPHRGAYVLRLVGDRHGPVLVRRRPPPPRSPAHATRKPARSRRP